jgi:peptide deformylase
MSGGAAAARVVSDTAEETEVREPDRVDPEGPDDERAQALAEETLRRRAVALEHIRKFGDPVLKSRASEIQSFGPELEREAERMIAIMRDAIGVGLAATQLGVMHRLLVFQAGPDATPTAVANPVIEWLADEQVIAEEGCLSLPRVAVDVERPLFARVRGLDIRGEPLEIEASGLEARVLQHEIDHLDGVLMLDRAPRDQRKAALRALREGGEYSPSAEEPAEEDTPAPATS